MAKRPHEDFSEQQPTSHTAKKVKHNPQASLLGLPGELRNRIYRFALLKSRIIKITASSHTEPGLLRTCRQIRQESATIFRRENKFKMSVVDHRPEVPTNEDHWHNTCRAGWRYSGQAHWQNLKDWMRRVHEGRVCGEKFDRLQDDRPGIKVAQLTTKIVVESMDMPWSLLEARLEWLKEGVKAGNRSFWSDDK